MKNTAIFILMLFALKSFGWGAPELASAEIRQKEYSIVTKLDKKKAFTKLTIWSAKTFANANESIKLKDAEAGVLIVKGNLSCKALKLGNGFAENQRIDFTMEINVDDKKVSVKITDLVGHSSGVYDDGARPSKKEEADSAFKECVDPFVDLIKKEFI